MSLTKHTYDNDFASQYEATSPSGYEELEWAYYHKQALTRDLEAERNPGKRGAIEAELFNHTKAYAGHI